MPRKQKFVTNSDIKTRQRYEIIKRTKNADVIGVKTEDGRHEHKFGQGGAFYTEDSGLAREYHDSLGQGGTNDVMVVPIEKKPEPGQRRTFLVPALPWHKEKENATKS